VIVDKLMDAIQRRQDRYVTESHIRELAPMLSTPSNVQDVFDALRVVVLMCRLSMVPAHDGTLVDADDLAPSAVLDAIEQSLGAS